MTHRIYITKSKAGHYAVTIRNAQGNRVFHELKLNSLATAKRIAFEQMDIINANGVKA